MRTPVKELVEGQQVQSTYLVQNLKVLQTKTGKPFANFQIADKTGSIPAIWWEYGTLRHTGLTMVDGAVLTFTGMPSIYNGKLQFKVETVSAPGHVLAKDFERTSEYDPAEMEEQLRKFVRGFENIWFLNIADLLFHEYAEEFMTKPAATGMHHAFKHGLLEHTLQMLQTGEKLLELPFYGERLNRDLCLFGLLFHDFGKIFEYGDGPSFGKTLSGVKVPHIPKMGALIYHYAKLQHVPDPIIDEMMSIVLSHHRFMEWGSPCVPSSPEALFVHYIDNLHGDVYGVLQRIENDQSQDQFVKHGFGAQAYTVPKQRFSDLLKQVEVADGVFKSMARVTREDDSVDGF
jgi:3'-5' exoribonuclease